MYTSYTGITLTVLITDDQRTVTLDIVLCSKRESYLAYHVFCATHVSGFENRRRIYNIYTLLEFVSLDGDQRI